MKMTFRPYEEVGADLAEYYALAEELKRSGVTIAAGTEYEIAVSADLLPTLDEWRRDPELASWVARVPKRVAAAWTRLRDDRCGQVEEMMAIFDDPESSGTRNISSGQNEQRA
jgi:hypothetical protein